MKILFYNLASPNLPASMVSDYELDMLLHGLISFGEDVYENFNHWYLRKNQRREDSKDIWGYNFSVYHLLDNEWKQPISTNKFDLSIIGLHWTQAKNDNYLEKIVDEMLSKPEQFGRVIVIDGWDQTYVYRKVAEKVKYFKRELVEEYEDVCLPISFAIPEEKIMSEEEFNKEKTYKYIISPLIPVNQSIDSSYYKTYIYKTEEEYYQHYKDSLFGLTSMKANYDCLRHYEIIANGAVPLFIGIQNCPPKTLYRFPTHLCIEALCLKGLYFPLKEGVSQSEVIKNWTNCTFIDMNKQGYIDNNFNWKQYYIIRSRFMKWLRQKGTTKELAKYVLNEVFNGDNN